MKKLIEVEMDGQAAVKQVNEMREGFRRLREVSFSPPPLHEIFKLKFWKEYFLHVLKDQSDSYKHLCSLTESTGR